MSGNSTLKNDFINGKNGSYITICLNSPPQINSNGIWGDFLMHKVTGFFPLPLLELQLIIIFGVTMTLHFFLKRFGLPVFIAQLIAGLILGPTWKGGGGVLQMKKYFFFVGSQEILGMLSVIGYFLYVFLMGVKIDLGLIMRTGKKSLVIGISSIFLPSLLSLVFVSYFQSFGRDDEGITNVKFIARSQSGTSFAVVALLLDHLKILNSELGRLVLSSALVADLGSLVLVIISTLFKNSSRQNSIYAFQHLGSTVGCGLVAVAIFRFAMIWIVKSTPKGRPVKDTYVCIIVLLVLVSGMAADRLKQTVFFGPFILGLAVPEGPPLGTSLVNKLEGIVSLVFVPLFITVATTKADLTLISENFLLFVESVMLLTAITAAKMAACMSSALYFKMPFYDVFALALIMSTKGIVELSVCSFFFDSQSLNDQTFAMLVLYILVISISTPILMKAYYDPARKYAGYQKRNVLNLKPNAELRILTCLHSHNDVPTLMKLLNASCPSDESPIHLHVLHLVELAGRTTPDFIAHKLNDENDTSEFALSGSVIQMLWKYEKSKRGAIAVEAFTAVSPVKFMHEDICTLAITKLNSLIILPFHRKWNREGFMESDDNTIRVLNLNVLDNPPCSVAILIDRGHFKSTRSFRYSQLSLFQIVVVFIGGQDDREALSFGRRMKRDTGNVVLTVIRLVTDNELFSHWDKILDAELLKDMKHSFMKDDEMFRYMEMKADEGSQTSTIMKTIAEEYDLIILGRRNGVESAQTSGLKEWNEFTELGVVGDLLASFDFNPKASVMVIQQQQQLTT